MDRGLGYNKRPRLLTDLHMAGVLTAEVNIEYVRLLGTSFVSPQRPLDSQLPPIERQGEYYLLNFTFKRCLRWRVVVVKTRLGTGAQKGSFAVTLYELLRKP